MGASQSNIANGLFIPFLAHCIVLRDAVSEPQRRVFEVAHHGQDPINAVPEGKALTLYDRQADGGWKISYDCFNSNVAPE